jgi:hypothetical protein
MCQRSLRPCKRVGFASIICGLVRFSRFPANSSQSIRAGTTSFPQGPLNLNLLKSFGFQHLSRKIERSISY